MMVAFKDDLGLSLSLPSPPSPPPLGFLITKNHHHIHPTTTTSSNSSPFHLNLMTILPSPSLLPHNLPWNPSSSDRSSFMRGIDVNRPAGADDDDVGVSSPNSTLSTVSGKRSSAERDSATAIGAGDDVEVEVEVERASTRGISDDEDAGDNSRKKLRLTKDQSAILEESFKDHNTLNPKQKLALAKRLGLRPRQVEVWFQNRRARTKLKQTEVDCEFLKRCFDQLTEENRRLQKEVAELRALKLSPHFYMQMTPPTTLTMCPSCERVAPPPPSTAAQTGPDARPAPDHHRPRPINPRVAAPVPIRPFEALKPRP